MRKHIFVMLLLAAALTLAGTPLSRTATAAEGRGSVALAGGAGGPQTGTEESTAFRFLTKLFGRGKKKPKAEAAGDKSAGPAVGTAAEAPAEAASAPAPKIERTTAKDAEKFVVAPAGRVSDATGGEHAAIGSAGAEAGRHLARGRSLVGQGKHQEAFVELSLATTLDPRNAEAHNLLGVALNHRGLHARAVESFKQALKLSPRDVRVMNNLGYSYYLNDDYSSAKKYLKRAAKLAPADDLVLNNLALVYSRTGKHKDALETFARAGDEFTARLNMAAIYQREGRAAQAVEQLEAAARLRPRSEQVWSRLAGLYKFVGRPAEAEGAGRLAEEIRRSEAATNFQK